MTLRPILYLGAVGLLASCGGGGQGQMIGVQGRPDWFQVDPYICRQGDMVRFGKPLFEIGADACRAEVEVIPVAEGREIEPVHTKKPQAESWQLIQGDVHEEQVIAKAMPPGQQAFMYDFAFVEA